MSESLADVVHEAVERAKAGDGQIDPATIMVEHAPQPSMQDGWLWCRKCLVHADNPGGPCLPYRLAEALAAKQNERDAWFDQAANLERYSSELEEALAASEARATRRP